MHEISTDCMSCITAGPKQPDLHLLLYGAEANVPSILVGCQPFYKDWTFYFWIAFGKYVSLGLYTIESSVNFDTFWRP